MTEETRRGWLELRRRGIGASEVGILFGVSPYGSPMSLYLDKIGEPSAEVDEDEAIQLQIGNELEGLVCRLAEKKTGRTITRNSESVAMPGHNFIRSTPDGDVVAPERPDPGTFEAKVVGLHNSGEWLDGLIPLVYRLQCQQQMMCRGRKWGMIAGLLLNSSQSIVCRDLEYDEELAKMIVRECQRFWHDHVLAKKPPPADDHPATARALKKLYPTDNGLMVQLGAPLQHVKDELVVLKARDKELQTEIRQRENELKAGIADSTFAEFPDGTGISMKTQARGEVHMKPITFRVLRMMKPKAVTKAHAISEAALDKLLVLDECRGPDELGRELAEGQVLREHLLPKLPEG